MILNQTKYLYLDILFMCWLFSCFNYLMQLNHKVCWEKFRTGNESISFQSSTHGGNAKFIYVVPYYIPYVPCISLLWVSNAYLVCNYTLQEAYIYEPNVLSANRPLGIWCLKNLRFFEKMYFLSSILFCCIGC